MSEFLIFAPDILNAVFGEFAGSSTDEPLSISSIVKGVRMTLLW